MGGAVGPYRGQRVMVRVRVRDPPGLITAHTVYTAHTRDSAKVRP